MLTPVKIRPTASASETRTGKPSHGNTRSCVTTAIPAGTHSENIEDVAVIDDTIAAHIVCHGFPGFPGGEFRDQKSYKAFFRVFRQSFSEMSFEVLKTMPEHRLQKK